MSNGTDGLSAQQIQTMQQRMAEALQRVVDKVELRKQCMEMAVRATSTTTPPSEILALARGMFVFLTEPAQQVVIKIDPP